MNALSTNWNKGSPTLLIAGLALAAILSSLVLYIATGKAELALTYALGIGVLLVAGIGSVAMRRPIEDADSDLPDWSVTVAAIDQSDKAIAITDRANRLVCANRSFVDWFGEAASPLNLPFGAGSPQELARIAREAWRDGAAQEEFGEEAKGGWTLSLARAGRGDDYLIWRIGKGQAMPQAALAMLDLSGPLGALFSGAGIEAVIVDGDGIIQQATTGFALRAAGDGQATLAGQEFVSFLRSDGRERIFFARETRNAAAQILLNVPIESGAANTPDATALMLLVDSGAAIGAAPESASKSGAIQIESLLASLPLGLAMTDRDGRFLFGNEAFHQRIGYSGRALPSFPTDLVVKEDKPAVSDAVRRHGRGPAASGEIAVRLTSSPEEPVLLGLAGARGLGEAAVLLSLAGSSEETQLKRQVAQATKMQAVGQLAGGVAHDFNNVLTAIIGTCDLMLLRHTPGDSDYDDIQQIRANSNRAASLTRQLLAFSRQQTLRPEIIQLPDVVSEVGNLVAKLLGNAIEYKVQHDRDLGPVRADPQQLEQVIMNLAVNARDAIEAHGAARGDRSGRITLSTRRVNKQDVERMGSEILPADDYSVLVMQDTGGGIAPEALSKLFEPFFTTKEMGKGTGLGLSTVYGIVKQSGGYIFADNIEGPDGQPIGARFTVYLPVYQGKLPGPAAKSDEAASSEWSSGGRILLVEDEDMVRAVAERALTRAGYEVSVCSDGEEGLGAVASGGKFDLIVSDVVMPVMDGPAMARAIRTINHEVPVLFMSGYAEEQLRSEIDIPDMFFIPKPFSVQQIGDKVASVLQTTGKQKDK